MRWDELTKGVNDPEDMDAQLIWRFLTIATTHPSYMHLSARQIFEAKVKEIQEEA